MIEEKVNHKLYPLITTQNQKSEIKNSLNIKLKQKQLSITINIKRDLQIEINY